MDRKKSILLCIGISLVAASLVGCGGNSPRSSLSAGAERADLGQVQEIPAQESGQFATDWFDLELSLIPLDPAGSPPVVSRRLGYLGITMYEALVRGLPGRASLVGRLNEFDALPVPEDGKTYEWHLVANAAMARITGLLIPDLPLEGQVRLYEHAAKMREKYRLGVSPDVVTGSEQYGDDLAWSIFAWASGDGAEQAIADQAMMYVNLDPLPGSWEPTPPDSAAPLLPEWGNNRSFMESVIDRCPASEPVPYSPEVGSEFYLQAMAVYQTTNTLTETQREVAEFWSDPVGDSYTPPGHWFAIAGILLKNADADLGSAAETYARLGIAVADAFIGCWNTKYTYSVQRPITYIQDTIDPHWNSPLKTPPFPEYTSGHSVVSGAVKIVLANIFGEQTGFVDNSGSVFGRPKRTFSSLAEATEEAAHSRLYGGIHYPFSIDSGLIEGECIGTAVSRLDLSAAGQ